MICAQFERKMHLAILVKVVIRKYIVTDSYICHNVKGLFNNDNCKDKLTIMLTILASTPTDNIEITV